MRLPALWMVSAFAAGILLGGIPAASELSLRTMLATGVAGIVIGFVLAWRGWVRAAWAMGLAIWVALGALAVRLERSDVPANHVTRLIEQSALDGSEPLRWRGRLRSDPVRLPWGYRIEIELAEVEMEGRSVPVKGGLRVSYFQNERQPEKLPEMRAGDGVEALVRARPPRNFQNPGMFDYRGFLARQGIHLTGSLRSLELIRRVEVAPTDMANAGARARGWLLARLEAIYAEKPDEAAVLKAMLLGDYNFIDRDLAVPFQKTAVYHVLVISGFQVAVLAAMVFWVGRRLRLGLAASTLLTLATLATFVVVVEDQPPIERAALMVTVYLAARLMFRRVELLNTVAVAALLILAARPSALEDASFQLSFAAVAMIGALGQPWVAQTSGAYRRALNHLEDVTRDGVHAPKVTQWRLDLRAVGEWVERRLPKWLKARASQMVTVPLRGVFALWEVLLISATIQLGMLPLLAYYFHRVSPVGPLANVPATLLSGLMVPLGYATLGGSAVWDALGRWPAALLGWMSAALVTSVKWFGDWSWGAYRVPRPPAWLMMAFAAALAAMAVAARAKSKRKVWQAVAGVPLVLLALAVAGHPFGPQVERGKLEVTVLDVGQGDAIYVGFPDGRTLLVDGGGSYLAPRIGGMRTGMDIGEQVVSPYLWERGLKRLDAVALTHAHQDHLDGLNAVLENFRVEELWVSREVDSAAFRATAEKARAKGVRVVRRSRGEGFQWDGVKGQVLWPDRESESQPALNLNNTSLVVRLEHGNLALLLPGDIERQVETELSSRGELQRAEFLKVPHHGSRTSTSNELVAAMKPQMAVVSVGETNPFGHPHPEVIGRLRAAGVRVLRTDRNGAVTVLSDGQKLEMRSYIANPREEAAEIGVGEEAGKASKKGESSSSAGAASVGTSGQSVRRAGGARKVNKPRNRPGSGKRSGRRQRQGRGGEAR